MCLILPLIKFGTKKIGKGACVYLVKDAIHSDYLFDSSLLKEIFEPKGNYVKVGWGDRKIFLETKTWSKLKIEDFMKAFFGLNKTVLRVDFLDSMPSGSKVIELNSSQLDMLKKYIKDSFHGSPINKKPEYYQHGDFYESKLRYNCFTNCNNWINLGLYRIGASNRIWAPISFWI